MTSLVDRPNQLTSGSRQRDIDFHDRRAAAARQAEEGRVAAEHANRVDIDHAAIEASERHLHEVRVVTGRQLCCTENGSAMKEAG